MNAPATATGERPLRFVIIGAGVSGIMAAIKLEAAGYHDLVIYEKANRAGGTWRDNTYPGIACDIPSHFYSYSFAHNPEWSFRYAPGSEILAYIEAVMRRYDIERRIRFGEEVARCEFLDGRWHVSTKTGAKDFADVLIAATGVIHHPHIPEIGEDTFAGALFHSARWNHNVQIEGRRIGVIGTGSSAVQIVSSLVKQASKLALFQRTAQWIFPQENLAYSEEEKTQFRSDAQAIPKLRAMLARRFTETFSNALLDPESPQFKSIEQTCLANLESQVRDPKLRERLRPAYRVACKRLVVSPDFYQAIQAPNAELVTERIVRVEPKGVRTNDGRLHELDVLVLATGFKTDRFMRPVELLGLSGANLETAWSERPRAYLTVAIPRFPNFFMLNGPISPVGNYPLIEVAELQMNYVLQLIEHLRLRRCREIAPLERSTARFDVERVAAAKKTVWASGCNSWYIDGEGVPAVWPWSIEKFYAVMSKPDLADFELVG